MYTACGKRKHFDEIRLVKDSSAKKETESCKSFVNPHDIIDMHLHPPHTHFTTFLPIKVNFMIANRP